MLDFDIIRGAHSMFERYGDTAELEAAQCADGLLNIGDLEGYSTWLQIVGAVKEVRMRALASGEKVP